ncbi:MAG: hypothetical protein IPH85_04220 [Ignavibacteria bacterium]|nr:hypothetical protein [Ignavibacteria bacterium]
MKHVVFLLSFAIASICASAQAPDFHYAFDGNSLDSSVNRANGNLFGEYGYGVDRTGTASKSIFFEASGQMYSFPKQLDGDQLSVSFWYKKNVDGVSLPSEPTGFPIAAAPDTNAGGVRWSIDIHRSSQQQDRLCFKVVTADGYEAVCIDVDTSWNHFAFVWSITGVTSEVKGYRNGQLIQTIGDLSANSFMEAHYLHLAGKDVGSLLDDLKVYRRLLSESEIAVLGEGGGSTSVDDDVLPIEAAHVSPCPATDHVSFVVNGPLQPTDIRIMDHLGRVVLQAENASSIPITTLGNGTYTAYAFADGLAIAMGRFVVLR